jgi:hypothetical protein
MRYFFYGVYNGISMYRLCQDLTAKGIPTAGEGTCWRTSSVGRWLRDPAYKAVAIAHRLKKVAVKATRGKHAGKTIERMIDSSSEDQIPLPDDTILEALVPPEIWDKVQEQLEINQEDSLRNYQGEKEEVGLLRCAHCHCGICGRAMTVHRLGNGRVPRYRCFKKTGGQGIYHNHHTSIPLADLDERARKKIIEVLGNPALVRQKVDAERKKNESKYSREDIEATISDLDGQMRRLFKLAQGAEKDETIDELTVILKDLERQKIQMEALLYDADADAQERAEIEAEIAKFEAWVEEVRPMLANPEYTPSYTELRLAVRIMGIHAIVFPAEGDSPFSVEMQASPPKIIEKLAKDKHALLQARLEGDERAIVVPLP